MISASFLVVAMFAQQSPVVTGMTPYVFSFRTNRPDLYAFVHPEDLDRVAIPVVIDEPWNKRVVYDTVQRTLVENMAPELSSLRRERLKKAWMAAGAEQIQDRSGKPYWVLTSDLRKRERAGQMLASAFPPVQEPEDEAAPTREMKTGVAAGPGFVKLWGAHIAIAAGALLCAGAVLWRTLKRPWSQV
jgi:hypothetical protein